MKIQIINLSTVFFLGASLLAPRVASATPNFPPAIQSNLSLAAPPDCGICHTDGDSGGKGTATTPFAQNMRARGLVEFDTGSLTNALAAMQSEHVDSVGDCLDDIDELKAGRNPNLPDPAGTCGDSGTPAPQPTPSASTPTYGCFGSIAPHGGTEDGGESLGVLAVLFLFRRRSRRNSQ